MSHRIKQFIFLCLLLFGMHVSTASAEGIKIKSFELERVDGDWLLNGIYFLINMHYNSKLSFLIYSKPNTLQILM